MQFQQIGAADRRNLLGDASSIASCEPRIGSRPAASRQSGNFEAPGAGQRHAVGSCNGPYRTVRDIGANFGLAPQGSRAADVSGYRMAALNRTRSLDLVQRNGRFRRILLVAVRPGEGPLTERTPAVPA